MIIEVPYEIAEDEATGEYGLVHTNGMPNVQEGEVYAAFDGSIIAHDNVEHYNVEAIGTPLDEVKAHGGVWYARIESGHTNPHIPAEKWLSYELGRMLGVDLYGTLGAVPNVKLDDEDVENSFRKAACLGVQGYLDEYCDGYDEGVPTWQDKLRMARVLYRALKVGYLEADDRWGTCHRAGAMFTAITEAVAPIIVQYVMGSKGEACNGQQFLLTYDTDELTARMCEVYEEVEDDE